MTCVNCGTDASGKYCSNCGQRLHVKRITFRDAFDDIWEHISGFDGKLLRTFKDLSLRPGFASREFISGNRARYYGPVAYYLLMVSAFLIYLEVINLDYVTYIKSMQKAIPVKQGDSEFSSNVRQMLSDNLKLFGFFIVPFIAYASRYIYFRKQGLNFLEHSVPIFYMMGHWYWFQMIEATMFRIAGFTVGSLWQTLMLTGYIGMGYITFVPTQSKGKAFFKGAGVYLTGFLLFMIFVAIVAGVWVFTMLKLDPSSLETLRPKH